MHIHATDPSVAVHRVVRILLFVLCLVSASEQLASIWPLAEKCSKLKAIHSMRRGAGIGKPDGPKRLPIALGAMPVHRVVHILLFVLCLVSVSEQLASIWPLASLSLHTPLTPPPPAPHQHPRCPPPLQKRPPLLQRSPLRPSIASRSRMVPCHTALYNLLVERQSN